MGKGSNFSRPVLIVKKFSSNVFWGVPLTTKRKKGSWYFYIKKINRTVILNQMRLFDKKRLESRLYDFKISNLEINAVRDKIIKLLKS